MGYQSKTIYDTIKDIEESKVYLPALQRKFVWSKQKIELLFDSLMRNYPIGTFLFWKLNRDVANTYVFYEFLKAYDERHPYNQRKTGSFLNPEIIGVLDGQQRLSSLYIGLQGTHTERVPRKHKSNDNSYRKTELYLNLLNLPYQIVDGDMILNEDTNFEFLFLTEHESNTWTLRNRKFFNENGNETIVEESLYWFRVGEVLEWNKDPELDVFIDNYITLSATESQKLELSAKRRPIRKALDILHRRIFADESINYFTIAKDDLEDILKIFVRVNSAGVPLSKTDLLFSTIVATWSDGREEIENLLQRINKKGDGFSFGNEFLMRSCLVLTDSQVLFKVNSFKTDNVLKIKNDWIEIANAIEKSVELLVEFGFSRELLSSQNVLIIIAYYVYKGGTLDNESKISIKKYLIHSLLNGIYGNAQDQLLIVLRNFLREAKKDDRGGITYDLRIKNFSFEELLKVDLPSRKSLYITENELETFMTYKKGSLSFLVLSLLYPQLRYKEVQFHQDHIHPASKFNNNVFDDLELTPEDREEWLRLRDCVPNLQLMEGRQNESKNAAEFVNWITTKSSSEQLHFVINNYIPESQKMEFSNFRQFYEARKDLLKVSLRKVLAISYQLVEADTIEFVNDTFDLEEVDLEIQ
ncbi:DUF262 domain-containing protein [Pedobacter sp. BMA]|uniref:GmrSD restriction endonuclease domain-containing protein n=1 Tax=Pedobacter sp. BMA TaxID=1663685 RepID=UPI00069FC929|nr:DUF262 domain-containing protein [Pedobacter sp. BMA]